MLQFVNLSINFWFLKAVFGIPNFLPKFQKNIPPSWQTDTRWTLPSSASSLSPAPTLTSRLSNSLRALLACSTCAWLTSVATTLEKWESSSLVNWPQYRGQHRGHQRTLQRSVEVITEAINIIEKWEGSSLSWSLGLIWENWKLLRGLLFWVQFWDWFELIWLVSHQLNRREGHMLL